MSLWNTVCSVLLCKSVRKSTHPLDEIRSMRLAGEFLLSRRIFLSLTELTDLTELLAHISNSQNAFGIQRTQSVSAIVDTDKEAKSSLHPPHMGISVITPLPFGGGVGGGASWGWGRGRYLSAPCVFCSSVFSVRKRTFLRLAGEFYLSQNSQISQNFLRTISSSQGVCTSSFDAHL